MSSAATTLGCTNTSTKTDADDSNYQHSASQINDDSINCTGLSTDASSRKRKSFITETTNTSTERIKLDNRGVTSVDTEYMECQEFSVVNVATSSASVIGDIEAKDCSNMFSSSSSNSSILISQQNESKVDDERPGSSREKEQYHGGEDSKGVLSSSSSSSSDEDISRTQIDVASSVHSTGTEVQHNDPQTVTRTVSTPSAIVGAVQNQPEKNIVQSRRNQNQEQQEQFRPPQHQQQQPEGWRVKLYRLNVDGGWDDCGTGRIVCLYFSPNTVTSKSNLQNNINLESSTSHTNHDKGNLSNHTSNKTLDQWLYQETGEATLCVHAEVTPTMRSGSLNPAASNTGSAATATNSEDSTNSTSEIEMNGTGSICDEPLQVLLQTRILLRDAYQRQGDNIITWCEPYYPSQKHRYNNKKASPSNHERTNNGSGVDLALSFQDNAGCLDIWRQITHVQRQAAALLRQHNQQRHRQQQHDLRLSTATGQSKTVEDMAAQAAAQHHATLQNEQQHTEQWSKGKHLRQNRRSQQYQNEFFQDENEQSYSGNTINGYVDNHNVGVSRPNGEDGTIENLIDRLHENERQRQLQAHHHQQQQQQHHLQQQHHHPFLSQHHQQHEQPQQQQWQLPSCPTLQNLEDISNVFGSVQHVPQHLETLVTWMIADDFLYLKQLLTLFQEAEERSDHSKLATLAACVKFVLLLNDPSILEWVVDDTIVFEQVCACFEYDPDLREKANHRWFLRECAKFRTVVPMEDQSLIMLIHRSFRVTFLRDTLLRPTMDESSLSTLTSMQTFTHNDVIKGVAMLSGAATPVATSKKSSQQNDNNMDHDVTETLKGSYMARVMRMLGVEIHSLTILHWAKVERTVSLSTSTLNLNAVQDKSQQKTDVARKTTLATDIEDKMPVAVTNLDVAENSTTWRQHLAPQDGSIESRRLRRRGCLCFLRELFNMARTSLPQRDKDDFFSAICRLEIDLLHTFQEQQSFSNDDGGEGTSAFGASTVDEFFREGSDTVSQTSQQVEVGSVASTVRSTDYRSDINEKLSSFDALNSATAGLDSNINATQLSNGVNAVAVGQLPSCTSLLSILANVVADPQTDSTEMNAALEIISGIAIQDPSLIRQHCIDAHRAWKKVKSELHRDGDPNILHIIGRPEPNEKKEVIFLCPPDDLLFALLYLFVVETDGGILLQASEIMRIILDTEMVGDHCGPLSPTAGTVVGSGGGIFPDDPVDEGYPSEKQINSLHEHHPYLHTTEEHATEQKQFLSMFYETYVEWLVIPFQCTMFHSSCRIPKNILLNPSESPAMQQYLTSFQKGTLPTQHTFLVHVSTSSMRTASIIELLSFCVRAHLYRMKTFLLKSRILGKVINTLRQPPTTIEPTIEGNGDRSLKLAALRFLRSILSMKDESYHRHIIQHNLFEPVIETFRTNPVRDNLISSAVLDILEFINSEKINSLLDHIVTKHMMSSSSSSSTSEHAIPSLEDVSSPYFSTFATLRKSYEANIASQQGGIGGSSSNNSIIVPQKKHNTNNHSTKISNARRIHIVGGGNMFIEKYHVTDVQHNHSDEYIGNNNTDDQTPSLVVAQAEVQLQPAAARQLTGKALEDQRKFQEIDEEESYFDSD